MPSMWNVLGLNKLGPPITLLQLWTYSFHITVAVSHFHVGGAGIVFISRNRRRQRQNVVTKAM